MLRKLKKRLIIQNTILTGAILSVVVIGACMVNIAQYRRNNLDHFVNLRDMIEERLQSDHIISNTWLSQLEAANQMIVAIEDNGSAFYFKGGWNPAVARSVMIKEARNAASAKNAVSAKRAISEKKIDSAKKTALAKEPALGKNAASAKEPALVKRPDTQRHSGVYDLTGHQEPAYASVSVIPADHGSLGLTLIQFRPQEYAHIRKQICLYTGADILGIAALFLVGCFFVRKALKPVEENQTRQNEFIAAVSHDLRTPLAVIQTNASALLVEGANQKRFVPVITGECTRMAGLLRDMLILASSDAKTWSIKKKWIDTDTCLIELYDTFSTLCNEKEHQLVMDFPDEPLPKVCVDQDRLTQVLGILINNAISYSPPKSRITMRSYVMKNTFYIEVEDQGTGIGKEQRTLIFDRFYRADKSRNDNTHFGLGLSVAKELMELQGGKIFLKNTGEHGSTFCMTLPL
jgi:OmpR-family two-component system manganese-sensing sensor histidine kinase